MRMIVAAVAACFIAGSALAADTEGQITAVDIDTMTITLENGETYKLPAEIDVSAIQEGMDVVIAYRETGDVKQITDMLLPE